MACFCAQGGPAVHGQNSCASPRAGFAGLPRDFCVDPQKYLRVAGEDAPQDTHRRRAKKYPYTKTSCFLPILLPGIDHLACLEEIRSVKDKPFYCQLFFTSIVWQRL